MIKDLYGIIYFAITSIWIILTVLLVAVIVLNRFERKEKVLLSILIIITVTWISCTYMLIKNDKIVTTNSDSKEIHEQATNSNQIEINVDKKEQ